LADRDARAALTEADLAFWQASGGDFLRISKATDFIRAYRKRSN